MSEAEALNEELIERCKQFVANWPRGCDEDALKERMLQTFEMHFGAVMKHPESQELLEMIFRYIYDLWTVTNQHPMFVRIAS